jgi:hypothetical protein
MRAAYLNQAINLLIAILMVPMLLRYLSLGEYILWAVFTTFGGITLQIESSIQILSVREIAKQYHAGDGAGVVRAVRRARKAYGMLAVGVLLPFFVAGIVYLGFPASDKVANHWLLEWIVFTVAYAINYFFGANNSILLALARVDTYNYVNSLTRTLNFLGSLLLLRAGFAVLGVCASFALSVLLGCALITLAARRALRQAVRAETAQEHAISLPDGAVAAADLVRYTLFTFFAFALYKGGVLIAASLFPKGVAGAYSLTLQALTMLSALSLVPIQIWLASFVKAIVADNRVQVIHELARTFLYANLVFIAGTAALVWFGNALLRSIGAHVELPGRGALLLAAAAFMIEINLFILINLLVTKRRYEFVPIYVACVCVGLTLALSSVWLTHDLIASLVVVPATIQAAVCLPLILRRVAAELALTPAAFLAMLGKQALERNCAGAA